MNVLNQNGDSDFESIELGFECGSDYNSSTYHPVRCGTKKCIQAKGTDCITCINHPLKTGCTNNTCGVQPFNPFAGFYVSGDVGQDTLSSAHSTTRARAPSNLHVPTYISSYVYPDKFGVEGFLLGLARGKMASSNSSSSTLVVASSYLTTSVFKFGSSPVPSTSLPLSSSGLELLETKRSQDAGAGSLSCTAFGSSSEGIGNFGFISSATKTVNSLSRSVVGASSINFGLKSQALEVLKQSQSLVRSIQNLNPNIYFLFT
ncbi:hypothetical protein LR48_Vigan06g078400 [Vigna angularis]|uniref:Xylanase inhibitor N-terminal domain-containing protein n=1 Tax=Phaseolus angularis TaxID=3914 RepID=A0A0L9URW6_PHAAN|nr:hypothetical protein LR48_Vigan06g078400 [Vigna angularis]